MIDPRRAAIDRPEDHLAIRQLYRHLLECWNRGVATEVAQLFGPESELIVADGRCAQGATAILALVEETLRGEPASTRVGVITRTRKISFHVGVLHGCIVTTTPGSLDPNPESAQLQTLVTSSEYGYWQIESLQSTPVQLQERPDLLEAFRNELRRRT